MTSYNTGNPIGSKDPRDLYDNAENLDTAVNTRTAESWGDRLGAVRKTWWGMEQDFRNFLISSGYQDIGDYAAGLEITARNQIFWRDGELYRAGASLALPYTTTGDWATEGDLFASVGDAALRQELGSPNHGASLVAYSRNYDGALPTTVLERISNEAVTPQEFGAIGDGVNDDTAAIQAALNTGKSVYIPEGTYNISDVIYPTADGQVITGAGMLRTTIQNITNDEPLFCFGNPYDELGSVEFCTVESLSLHGRVGGSTLWGVFAPNAGVAASGEFEGLSSSTNNYYYGKTSRPLANWLHNSRGCALRDVRIKFVYGGYALHVSAWDFLADRVTLWSGQRGLRNSGAANSNHYKDLYISSMSREGIIHPASDLSIPTACSYSNIIVQQCGVDDDQFGSIAFRKGQSTVVDNIYLERNNEKGGATDIFIAVNEIGCTIESVRHREEGTGHALQTIVRTEGKGTTIGSIVFASNVNELVKITGTDSRTETYIRGPFMNIGANTAQNGYIVDESTSLKTKGFAPDEHSVGVSLDSVRRLYKDSNKLALAYSVGSSSWLALEAGGGIRFSSDIQNSTSSAGHFIWETNGKDGNGDRLLTLQASNGSLFSGKDGESNLGSANNRWNNIYAVNGVINTSDEREKEQIRSLTEAEYRVGKRLKELIKIYKMRDAVAIKGDKAREHIGWIAQEVKLAFESEGLDGFNYGCLCFDDIAAEDEELDETGAVIKYATDAVQRFGVRESQIIAFILASDN
ncbi:glycosyl hydrolase family 28-related protein [Oligella urethralis]|uniref:tail fiber domain-containing protein n=1 Tax=Oligella urethralis TaxID=90245 RepID=UPI00254CB65B|nr:glycosyl hydrolase family 28-related protein [Oligella urethralis]MDK6203300.1 glycosyl hydrolase family 28-related protein [Oligella urethralis]